MIEFYAVTKTDKIIQATLPHDDKLLAGMIKTMKTLDLVRLIKVYIPGVGLTVHTLLGIGTWDIFNYPNATGL